MESAQFLPKKTHGIEKIPQLQILGLGGPLRHLPEPSRGYGTKYADILAQRYVSSF